MVKIINFHEITNPQWFEDTIKIILSLYNPINLQEVIDFHQGKSIKGNNFHITVDDGDLSNYHTIYPILKKYNLTTTIFVSPYIAKTENNFWFQEIEGYNQENLKQIIADRFNIKNNLIKDFYVQSMLKNMRIETIEDIISIYQKKYNEPKKNRKNMNVSELLELHHSGHFNIGAHTLNHPILANETDLNAQKQIVQSINELSDILNKKVQIFAYPNGDSTIDFGQREINILKNTSVKHAFTFDFKNLRKFDNPYLIPRFGLHHGTPDYIKRKLYFGEYWEILKKGIFNTETKHRKQIQHTINLID